MAFITFIARNRDVASYRLTHAVTLGRSLDCDIYLPDAFVSRTHCRFVPDADGWLVEDLGSANGIYLAGRRISRRYLCDGDLLEVGTVGIAFDPADLPAGFSRPTPFGEGRPATELVDTIFTGDLRPAQFAKLRQRVPAWKRRHAPLQHTSSSQSTAVAPAPEREDGEWTELDMEIQLEIAIAAQPLNVMDLGELEPLSPAAPQPRAGRGGWRRWIPARTPRRTPPPATAKPSPPPKPSPASVSRRFPETIITKSTFKDRLADAWQALRSMELRDMLDAIRARPGRSVAAVTFLGLILGAGLWMRQQAQVQRAIDRANRPLTIDDITAQGN